MSRQHNRPLQTTAAALGLSLVGLIAPALVAAQSYVPNRVIVKFMPNVVSLPTNVAGASTEQCQIESGLVAAVDGAGVDSLYYLYPGTSLEDTLQCIDDSSWVTVEDVSEIYVLHLSEGYDVLAAVDSLRHNEGVLYAEPDYIANLAAAPNDTWYSRQYQLLPTEMTSTHPQETWDYETGDSSIRIALLDSGVDYTLSDFGDVTMGAGKHIPLGYDWYDADSDPRDTFGHGTFAAGEIGACSNNGIGVAGIAGGWSFNPANASGAWGVSICPVRIAGPSGDVLPTSEVAKALREAAAGPGTSFFGRPLIGARIIHINIEGQAYSETMRGAINYASRLGRTIVAPKGNVDGTDLNYPSDYDHDWIISVGAVDRSGASDLAYGNGMDVVALGSGAGVYSMGLGETYHWDSGTSFSSPLAVGEAALLVSTKPDMHPGEVEGIIRATATKLTPEAYSDQFGAGLINVSRATSLLRSPWHLERYSATGGSDVSHTSSYQLQFAGVPGAPAAGTHYVSRYDVRRTVSLGSTYRKGVYVFGRGPSATVGWSDVGSASLGIQNYATGFCNVVSVDSVAQTAVLQTFVYWITDVNHSYWAPCAPSGVVYAYSVAEREIPLAVAITGPDSLSGSANGTWTAAASGGSGGYTYQWRWRTSPAGAWSSIVGTASTYSRTMQSASFQVQVQVTSGNSVSTATKWVYFRPSGGSCEECDDPPILQGAGRDGQSQNVFHLSDGVVRLRLLLGDGQSPIQLRIYSVTGRVLETVAAGELEPGWHNLNWRLREPGEGRVSPGVYFALLEVAGSRRVSRILLLP